MSVSIGPLHRLCGCKTSEMQKFDVNLFESLMDEIRLDEAFRMLCQAPSAEPLFLQRFLLSYAEGKDEIVSLVILELSLSLQLSSIGLIDKLIDPLSFGSMERFFIYISQERFSPFDPDGKLPADDEVIESKLSPEKKFVFVKTLTALLKKHEQYRESNSSAVIQTIHSLLKRLDRRVELINPINKFKDFSREILIANLGNQTSSLLQQITYFEPLSRKTMIELFQPCKELVSLWTKYSPDPRFSELSASWKKVIDETLSKIKEFLDNKEYRSPILETCPGNHLDTARYPKIHFEKNIAFLKLHLVTLFCAEKEFDEAHLKETIGYLDSLLKQCQKLSYIENCQKVVVRWQKVVGDLLPTIETRIALFEAKSLFASL